jgi:hypothetical protein
LRLGEERGGLFAESPSGEGRRIDYGLEIPCGGPVFAEYLGCLLLAAAAAAGDAKRALQLPDVADAGLGSATDLLIGDPVTDADVHGATILLLLDDI